VGARAGEALERMKLAGCERGPVTRTDYWRSDFLRHRLQSVVFDRHDPTDLAAMHSGLPRVFSASPGADEDHPRIDPHEKKPAPARAPGIDGLLCRLSRAQTTTLSPPNLGAMAGRSHWTMPWATARDKRQNRGRGFVDATIVKLAQTQRIPELP